MKKESAIKIPISVWQDPQGDIVLNISERECVVFFGCWDENGELADYLAKVTFKNCWSSKYTYSQFLPYKIEEDKAHSYILKVKNSSWLTELITQKKLLYPNDKNIGFTWDKKEYSHFVVQGHDVYIDIIASEFSIETIQREYAGDLVRLIDEA